MRTLLTALLFSLVPLTATAAVFERDLFEPGDGLLTYDDVNQREWLDLTYTAGKTATQILKKIQQDSTLEGFWFANMQDIIDLSDSAQVRWMEPTTEDPYIINNPNQISPGTSPNLTVASPKLGKSGEAALRLLTLLGPILTTEEEFLDVNSNTRFVITDSITFGQISVGSSSDPVALNGTNALLIYGSSIRYSGESILSSRSNGAFTNEPSSIFPQATGNAGPFWLYRAAIPEPSTTTLLMLASVLSATTRSRRRRF